jgi:ATP-dependent DNA helicase RecG
MADLNTDVRYIKGIGEQRAKALGKLGIATLRDLISYFPRAYDDRSALRRIADLVPGETAGVAAMVASPPTISHIRKGLDLVKLRAVDDTGTLDVTFFNQDEAAAGLDGMFESVKSIASEIVAYFQ